MCPLLVALERVPDRELGPLLTQLARAGFHNPIVAREDDDEAF